MAEYAGLEIRIGGNTSKLNSALKASTKSAAELQSRIRQVTRAMQFDPKDLKNVETRIKLTGDRMESLQAKAQLVRTAMGQLGDTMVKFRGDDKSIRDIAGETDNLSLAAKQADERYAKLTGSLAEVYEAWNRITRSEGKDFAQDKLGIDAKTADYLMSASTSLRDFRTELNEINRARSTGLDVGKDIITPEQLATLTKFKELNFHNMFKNGIHLEDAIQEARELGVAISDDAVANVRELQETFKNAAQEKEGFDKALKFEQMGTDLQRINSEAESLSQTMRWLDDSISDTTKTPWFQGLEQDISKIDAALDNVEADLERTEAAMKVDPKNIELAARYMQDLQQKVSLSEEKTKLLQTEMSHLEMSGAKEAARDHQDLAKWIEESAENARVAKKELSEQQATVANLSDALSDAQRNLDSYKRDRTLAEASDNVQNLAKRTQELANAEQDLSKARSTHASNQKDVEDYTNKLEEAKKKVEELEAKEKSLREEREKISELFKNLSEGNLVPTEELYKEVGAAEERWNELPAAFESLGTASSQASRDVTELENSLSNAQDRFKTSAEVVSNCENKVAELGDSIEKLKQSKEVKLLGEPEKELEEEEKAIEHLKEELEEARAEEKRRQEAYNSAAAENNLAKEAKAYDDVEQEIEEARVKMLEAKEAMNKESGSILNPSTLKSIGMTMSATVTPFIAGIGRSMIDASKDIDTAYRNMRKTVQGSEEDFESLRKHAMDFATTHVTSADQILEIEALGGELGVATKDLEAFAEAISNIDVSTDLNTEEAAETLGHLSNILHLSAEDYEGFADALVRLGNNGASTESEIANIAERIGSMGSIVGMSASDILAWSSSIASTGQNAEAAGTAISKTMSFFETAVSAAGGSISTDFESINAAVQSGGDELIVFSNLVGKTADEFTEAWDTDPDATFEEITEAVDGAKDSLQGIADVAHMTADDFAKTWESDPTAAMEAFIKGLNDVEKSGGSADAVLQSFKITSVRQKQAIEGLMQTIDGLDDNLKMSEDAWKGISDKWGQAGDAANEASKKAEGFSGQLQIMKNMAQNTLSELGEGAAPWIQRFTGILGTLTEIFSGLSASSKEAIVAVGGVTMAMGPLLTIASTLGTSKENIMRWASESVTGLSIVTDTYKKLGDEGVRALTGTNYAMSATKLIAKELGAALVKNIALGSIIAGVVVLTTALKELYDSYQDHIAATSGLSDAIANIGDAAKTSLGAIEDTERSIGDLIDDASGSEKRLADLSRTIEDSNKQYSTYAGQMDYYAEAIKTLGNKTERSEQETYKLEAALQAVNEACGTTYGLDEYGNIIDTETGKTEDNTQAILDNIEARKQQALVDYYSDDYTKALEEWAAAQDLVTELEEKRKDLQSRQGHDDYIENYIATTGRADLAEQAYKNTLDQTEIALSNAQAELEGTSEAMGVLEEKMSSAREELDKHNESLNEAAAAQEEYDERVKTYTDDVTGNMKKLSDALDSMGGDDKDFNAIAKGLEEIYVSAEEIGDVDMSALATSFDDANGSMEQIVKTLEDGGVHMTTWNSALEQAPGAAEKMGSVTAAAFDSMYSIAGNDINATMTLIAGLDMVQVEDKTFYIGDNGSIADSEGKVYDLKKDIDKLPKQVVAKVKGDNKDAKTKTKDTNSDLDKLGKRVATAKIKATDYASSTISSVSRAISNLNGKTATTYVKTVKIQGKQATGGLNSRPVIPEHASGYIATGPTLTNQGWIGEDGIEAVANWATGGAVVPLTNKRYMLPIADAIADGMARRAGGIGGEKNITLYVTCEGGPDETASAIVRALEYANI